MHARIAFLLFSIKVVAAGNSLSFVRSLAPSVCVCAKLEFSQQQQQPATCTARFCVARNYRKK
jgi:hypothetical protein